MAWVALSFAYKEVLASTKMNQIQTNLNLLVRTDLGGQTIATPSAVTGLTIDQNYSGYGLVIDSEATGAGKYSLWVKGKWGPVFIQDLADGYGLIVNRNLNEVGSLPLVKFINDHIANTQITLEIEDKGNTATGNPALKVTNNSTDRAAIEAYGNGISGIYAQGATYDFVGQNFHVTPGGYISAGSNEALIWDVVEFTLTADGADSISTGYTLDGNLCMGLLPVGWEVSEDDVNFITDRAVSKSIDCYHDGVNLVVRYDSAYVIDDEVRVIVFIKKA